MSPSCTENRHGQPIGLPVAAWQPARRPDHAVLTGRYCRLEPLDAQQHAASLWQAWRHPDPALADDREGEARWTYLGGRPFADETGCQGWLRTMSAGQDPWCYAIVDPQDDQAVGMATYLNIVPDDGRIEIGHLNFSPRMARSRLSSEALMLLMAHAFALGYRRLEWKCDALNAPSRRAAERLGFRFEGIFRQHRVVQGRNRDTAWFSVIDHEWPALHAVHRQWLDPDNFTAAGAQRQPLATHRPLPDTSAGA
ncbi:N-acetyltransferase [Salinicola endophyticus]|uniref:N-acetyltransferase n=1 Tax=Salinicola endophyticus TaxID=1949083 RepID=A0ABY8FLT5_9GAMM|nr:GNAT family protein [Salinicola endophyticus]WFF42156.1 N-acetyltransferase [Salinicola endophyticus]